MSKNGILKNRLMGFVLVWFSYKIIQNVVLFYNENTSLSGHYGEFILTISVASGIFIYGSMLFIKTKAPIMSTTNS